MLKILDSKIIFTLFNMTQDLIVVVLDFCFITWVIFIERWVGSNLYVTIFIYTYLDKDLVDGFPYLVLRDSSQ